MNLELFPCDDYKILEYTFSMITVNNLHRYLYFLWFIVKIYIFFSYV